MIFRKKRNSEAQWRLLPSLQFKYQHSPSSTQWTVLLLSLLLLCSVVVTWRKVHCKMCADIATSVLRYCALFWCDNLSEEYSNGRCYTYNLFLYFVIIYLIIYSKARLISRFALSSYMLNHMEYCKMHRWLRNNWTKKMPDKDVVGNDL